LENVQLPESLLSSNLDLNVYVRIELLGPASSTSSSTPRPSGRTAKTRMIKSRSNPVFDESFHFSEQLCDLFDNLKSNSDTAVGGCFRLVFNVCNLNLFGRDQIIGQTVHNLVKFDQIARIYSKKVDLVDSKFNNINLGQLHLSLDYIPANKVVKFHVLKATNLKMPKVYWNSEKTPNSFVKVYMLYRGQRVDKKQTKTVEQSASPVYDETFEFSLEPLIQQEKSNSSNQEHFLLLLLLRRIHFILLVMDSDQIDKSDVIGKIEMKQDKRRKSQAQKYDHHHHDDDDDDDDSDNDNEDERNSPPSNIDTQPRQQTYWYDCFYEPDLPVLCTFQIDNF
jgi:Ca2+-dependent lipid-binding protein